MGVSVRTARRAARDLDRRRLHFDRTMYRANSNDPHNFDMVLDSNSLGLEIAAEILVRAVEAGRPEGVATGPLLRPGPPIAGLAIGERPLTASDIWGAPLPVPADMCADAVSVQSPTTVTSPSPASGR